MTDRGWKTRSLQGSPSEVEEYDGGWIDGVENWAEHAFRPGVPDLQPLTW